MTDKERVEMPIMQLSLLEPLSSLRAVKSADRKKEDVVVFDARIIRTLWCKMMTVIDEVNRLKKYITQPLVVAKGCEGTIGNNDFTSDYDIEKLKEVIGLKEQEDETIDSVMAWHRKTFPNATANGQLNKWDEEYAEFRDACRHGTILEQIRELVDLFVVACGIMRFNTEAGCMKMLHWCELRKEHAFFLPTVREELNKKMRKNRARKWEYLGNGNYHHVKGVED